MTKKKKRIIIGVGTLTILTLLIVAYFILPWHLPDGELYFKPPPERTLLQDEEGQFNFVYDHYSHLEITGDEFHGWDTDQQLFWRYGIAFTAYGMPSISMISPKYANTAKHAMKVMISKMKSKKVWRDFVDYGMAPDPISKGNIMYKGHLNLMYGLYQMVSGDTLFAREYTWLTQKIVQEMREHHREGKHEGADCEPGRYFAQCNAISLMSLHVYDKLYGTDYTNNEVQWTLEFLRKRLTDPTSGLYKKMYNSTGDFCDPYLSGYTNGWTIAFLNVLDPTYHNQLYNTWKATFVKEIGPFAFVKEYPTGGPSPIAHLCGLIAAKEFGDIDLFTKLRNALDRNIKRDPENNHMKYNNFNNAIYNGPILWTKVHVGFGNLLNHDWGLDNKQATIPDVSNMVWTDILDDDLMLLGQN